jgi:uncharacterized protein (DUF427 family)
MALTLGSGPLAGSPGGAFNFSLDDAPRHRIFFEAYPRRLRGLVGDTVVVDTVGARLLHETAIRPVAYVPLADVDASLLSRTDTSTHCPFKGDASYWTLTVGDRVIEDALWGYEEPLPDATWLRGFGAFYWDKLDTWLVEDERVASLRDPYHRVDVHASSRPVVVRAGGRVIAQSSRPKMLFETSLAPRVYLPREDVAEDVAEGVALEPSSTRSRCPYKGDASYWSVRVDGRVLEDVAWSYEEPLAEAAAVAGHVSFDGEGVEVELGE